MRVGALVETDGGTTSSSDTPPELRLPTDSGRRQSCLTRFCSLTITPITFTESTTSARSPIGKIIRSTCTGRPKQWKGWQDGSLHLRRLDQGAAGDEQAEGRAHPVVSGQSIASGIVDVMPVAVPPETGVVYGYRIGKLARPGSALIESSKM